MGKIKDKLSSIWQDKRTFKVRAPLSILTALAFTFTVFIFGPCEIYASNTSDMQFTFENLLTSMIPVGLLVFSVLLAILLLARGKVFNTAISLLFAGTVAGYLQGNSWNIDHGALMGNATNWPNYKVPMLLNCVMWLCVFAAVFLLLYVSRRVWTKGLNVACIILIGVQIVALSFLSFGKGSDQLWTTGKGEAFLSRDGMFELSSKNNVIVFLLDYLDNRFTDELLLEHPEWKEELGDFTYYHDTTGSYTTTRPSITYLLTGVQHDQSTPWDAYFHKAWTEPVYTLLPDIHDAGSRTRVYADSVDVFGSVQYVSDFVENVRFEDRTIDRARLVEIMLDLSAYRYAPEAMKPYFQISSDDLRGIVSVTGEDETDLFYELDDVEFWREFREDGLSVDPDSEGSFVFYHLDGAHAPYYMDENAEPLGERDPVTESDNMYKQVTGDMSMIFQYMNEMKDMGLYEDSTIIIMSDHGRSPRWNGEMSDVLDSRVSTLLIKPAGVSGNEQMQVSKKQVSHDNLRASIASYTGLDSSEYGRTIESLGEEEQTSRIVWIRGVRGDVEDKLFTFQITGDANDFTNWELIGTTTMEYPEM